MEVPAGMTSGKEPAAAALPGVSLPIPVQITVVSAQNLVKSENVSTNLINKARVILCAQGSPVRAGGG